MPALPVLLKYRILLAVPAVGPRSMIGNPPDIGAAKGITQPRAVARPHGVVGAQLIGVTGVGVSIYVNVLPGLDIHRETHRAITSVDDGDRLQPISQVGNVIESECRAEDS